MSDTFKTVICMRYRYRMRPTSEQEEFMRRNCGAARYVYNRFQEMGEADMKAGRKVKKHGYPELFAEAPWLKKMDSYALDSAKCDYYKALSRYREDPKVGKPRKKKKKTARKSYRSDACNGRSIWLKKNKLKLPKMKPVRIEKHRNLPTGARITSVTVIEETRGEWYASICFERELEIPRRTVIAFDCVRGLDYSSPLFYVDDLGDSPELTHEYRENEDKLSELQARKDRREYESANWWKAKDAHAKASAAVVRKRKEFVEQASARMAKDVDIVIVEDLNLRDMAGSLKLGKSTNDNGFGAFRNALSYKLSHLGRVLVKVPKMFASSKTCNVCGNKNDALQLGESSWKCPNCSAELSRDMNAARSIREMGLFGLFHEEWVSDVVTVNGEFVVFPDMCEGMSDDEFADALLLLVREHVLPSGEAVLGFVFDAESVLVDEDGFTSKPIVLGMDAADAWASAVRRFWVSR